MKRISGRMSAWVAAVLVACVVLDARAQVLQQVPSDAIVVVRLKNLTEFNDKAAALAKQMGLVEMNPAAADPLAAAMGAIGFTNGVDKSADAALVVANGNLDGDQPPIILLIPVTDYKAFVGNFADAKKDGDLDVFKMATNGQPEKEDTYAANWGKYAALTPVKELLAKKPEGFKTSGATARELAAKDIVAVVNFKVLGPKLTEQINGHKGKWMADVDQAINKQEKLAKYSALIKAGVTQGLAIATEFLGDASAASFSINLTKDGVATSSMAEFEPATHFGKVFSSIQGTTAAMPVGLPDAKYIIFGGGIKGGDAAQKMIEDFMQPIEAELAKAGDEVKPALVLLQTFKSMMAAEKSQAMGVIAPTGAVMASPLIQTISVITGDAKVLLDGQLKIMEAQADLMKLVPNQPATQFAVVPNAKTLDGVSFTKFTNEITGTDAASMQAKQIFAVMYGPAGASGYSGAVDDQHALTFMGIDDATASAAIKAIRDNNDPFSKNPTIAAVARNLPQNRVAVFYVDLGLLITTGTNYAKMFGVPMPVNIKPDLAPIGIAIATDGPAIRVDSYIPADLIESITTTIVQLKMMGAGGRGKPGGL